MRPRRLAREGVDRALASSAGDVLERALVRVGHAWPRDLPMGAAIRAALRRRHRGGDLTVRLVDGTELCVPPVPEMFVLYLSGRPLQRDVWRLLDRLVRPGDVVFDAGANVGVNTMVAARRCGAAGRVHAFEPQRELAPRIEESARRNGLGDRIVVHCVAVAESAADDARLLPVSGRPDLIGVPSLLRHEWLDGVGVEVRSVPLDSVVEREGAAPDVVKLDIEGAELAALRGFEATLRESPPQFIVCELLPRRARFESIRPGTALRRGEGSTEAAALFEHLEERGYSAHDLLGDGRVGGHLRPDDAGAPTDVVFARPEGCAARPWVFA